MMRYCSEQSRLRWSLFHYLLSRTPAFDRNMNLLRLLERHYEGGIVPGSRRTHRCIAVRTALSRLLVCLNSLFVDNSISATTVCFDAKSYIYQYQLYKASNSCH